VSASNLDIILKNIVICFDNFFYKIVVMYKYIKINLNLIFKRIHEFRTRHIDEKSFLILVSIFVGIMTGLVSVILKSSVKFIEHLLQFNFNLKYQNYFYILYPLIGIGLTYWYINTFHRGKFRKGLSDLINLIFKNKIDLEKHNALSQIFSSALTVGFGGSVGLEAPIVVAGSAIGINTANKLKLNYKTKTLLLACGAAGGISAIFNSPIAGVIFAMEVLLPEFTIPAFIPLLIASAVSSVVSKLFGTEQIFVLITTGWKINAIPLYFMLGIFCGLFSAYFIKITYKIEKLFSGIRNNYIKIITGGIVLGLLIFLLPPLYGEGYKTVESLFEGNAAKLFEKGLFYDFRNTEWFVLIFVFSIIMLKVFATAITIGAGGNGGTIAPSLFTGALVGFLFSRMLNLTGLVQLNETNFVAVGMAGVLAGVIHAPLTGIFLIAEVTGGYALIVPLMIVSALSFFISRYIEPYSVYTKTLSEKGAWFPGNRDKNILEQINLSNLVEDNFIKIKANMTLRQIIKAFSISKRNIFPVVDDNNVLLGIITLDDIREIIIKDELYDIILAFEIMTLPPAIIDINEKMEDVMDKFENLNAWNLPVINEGKYIGFVSKSSVFNRYRDLLIKLSNNPV